MIYPATRRARCVTAAAGLTAALALTAAPALTATPALAAAHPRAPTTISVAIDQWTATGCHYSVCLWYHQGHGTGGAGWGANSSVSTITGTFFIPGNPGNQGMGQAVRNNAASMSEGCANCLDTVFIYPNFIGDSNYLTTGWGGNLTSSPDLHNNEASVEVAVGG